MRVTHSIMARLRFPGRPGCRADRVRIPYCADAVPESADPSLQVVSTLRRGLQEFKELFGDSEDEEFTGFTEEDARLSAKKLRAALRAEQKLRGNHPESSRGGAGEQSSLGSRQKSAAQKAALASGHKSQNVAGIFGGGGGPSARHSLSKEEILRKALAAKQLLASLKAKHKHALQGRVVDHKIHRRKKRRLLEAATTEKKAATVEKKAAVSEKKPAAAEKKAAAAEKKTTAAEKKVQPDVKAETESKRKLISKRADRKSASYQTPKVKLASAAEKTPRTRGSASVDDMHGVKKVSSEEVVKAKRGRPRKDRSITVVKQLLQKARQGVNRPLAKVKGAGHGSAETGSQKRAVHTFVLPQFSRSRRAIIPNKRFIEDDPIPSALLIKRPRTELASSSTSSSSSADQKSTESVATDVTPEPKNGKPKAPAPQPPTTNPKKRGLKSTGETALKSPPVCSTGRKSQKSTPLIGCTPGRKAGKTVLKMEPSPTPHTPSTSRDESAVEQPSCTPSTEQLQQLEMSPVVAVTPHKMEVVESASCGSDLLTTADMSFRKGLLEQPLIVEGKRQRVPSLKMRLTKHQLEESTSGLVLEVEGGDDGEDLVQNGSKKEKFTLFPKAPSSAPKTFNRAGPMKLQRRDKDGKESILTKRSGQIMLRKAKLQLNRTALNRSKAALARSLKAQLKREAKQKGRRSEPQRHSPRPGVTSPLSISVLGAGGSHPFDSPNSQPSPLMAGLSPGSQGGFASPPRIVSSLSPISLPSKKEAGEGSADRPKESSSSEMGGPRIKHVCRRAAVVLPKPLATFPARPDPSESPTLSALPSPEKERLLQSQAAGRDEDRDSSDEERPPPPRKPRVIPRARLKLKKTTAKPGKFGRFRRRKGRCKECKGCLAPNCGKCVYCLDSKKFGGKNILRQACVNRTCERPQYSKQATAAFIQPKSKGGEGDEVDSSQVRQGPSRQARPSASYFASLRDQGGGEGTQDEGEEEGGEPEGDPPPQAPRERSARAPRGMDAEGAVIDEGGLEIMSAVGVQRHNLTHHARRLLKRKEKSGLRVRMPVVVPEPMPLVASSTLWSVPANTRSIVHTELKDSFYLDVAWSRGLALTMAGPTCVRAVCFLCGSAGREKLLYCSICCEPFHLFCLEDEDRPLEGASLDNWCCRRCQFCHVCGLQTGLLQCDRCQDTYHPECLGPAYPKQPSRRNVWVCTKCVRCKSCGATTPGSGHNATWTYDFSLCFDCGKLMDKGNFCPICRKCYTDDDWESKMVQCSMCESWVHARCEGLTDEMYQFFSYLPEDIQYRCRMCSPCEPPEWRTILHEELLGGLRSVLTGLTSFKCSHHLLVFDEAKEKERAQRALQRKKAVGMVSNCEAVRTSPRSQRLSRSAHPATDQCTEAEREQETGSTGGSVSGCTPPDKRDVGGASVISNNNADSADVMVVSDSEADSPSKSCHSPALSRSDSDLGSSGRGSHGKAAKMSEVGIFERLSQGCTEDAHCVEKDAGSGDRSRVGGDGDGPCSSERAKEQPRCEGPCDSQGTKSAAVHNSASESAHDDSSPSLQSNTNTAADEASTAATSQSEKPSSLSNKSPSSVARNLFETFFSISNTDSQEGECSMEVREGEKEGEGRTDTPDDKAELETADVASAETENISSVTPQSVAPGNSSSESCVTSERESGQLGSANSCVASGEEITCTSSSDQNLTEGTSVDVSSGVGVDESSPSSNPVLSRNTESGSGESSAESIMTRGAVVDGDTMSGASSQPIADPVTVLSQNTENSRGQNSAEERTTTNSASTEENMVTSGVVSRSAVGPVTVTVNMVTEATHHRSAVACFERSFPRDFNAVRMKLEADTYASVEEFNEDMVHIIQTALTEDEHFPTRRKQDNSVKSIFIKQMERVFPWFNVKACQLWQHSRVLPKGMLPDAVVPPYLDHTYAQWLEREKTLSSPQLSPFKAVMASPEPGSMPEGVGLHQDVRQCALCLEVGDDFPDGAGRLLYAGQDDWVHVNCALWSAEVFEEADGSLQNVHVAMVRGRQLRCNRCQVQGATVGCCMRGCPSNYHFLCARRQHCLFKLDKTVFCFQHREHANSQVENQKDFAVRRRVCVDMADIRCMKKSWARGLDAAFVNILFGSCTVDYLGSLAPLSDCKGCLLPLDFRCTRVFWSTVDARRRTSYTCRIVEVRPTPPTPELVLRDVRVVHDPLNPDYIPLTSLDLPSMGLSHLMVQSDDIQFVSHTPASGSGVGPMSLKGSSHGRKGGVSEATAGLGVPEESEGSSQFVSDASASGCSVQTSLPLGGSGEDGASHADLSTQEDDESWSQCGYTAGSSSSQQQVDRSGGASSGNYSGLSQNTLKLLNISAPKELPASSHPPPPPPPSSSSSLRREGMGQGEFGNLTGMVERLNKAAMRSKTQDRGKAGQRIRRCSSVDRPAFVPTVSVRQRRSMSLSPVGFRTNSSAAFPSAFSPPARRPLSPLDGSLAGCNTLRQSPRVTPILEQLESELMENTSQGRRAERPSSAPVGKEMVIDLTAEEEGEGDGAAASEGQQVASEDKEVVAKGDGEECGEDVSGDMALAQHVLNTVPEEMLEGSEVKVLVVPEDVSEEEALRLAQEALLQDGPKEEGQTTQQKEGDKPEQARERTRQKPNTEDRQLDCSEDDDSRRSTPADLDDYQVVGQLVIKPGCDQGSDIAEVETAASKSVEEGSASSHNVVTGSAVSVSQFLSSDSAAISTVGVDCSSAGSPENSVLEDGAARQVLQGCHSDPVICQSKENIDDMTTVNTDTSQSEMAVTCQSSRQVTDISQSEIEVSDRCQSERMVADSGQSETQTSNIQSEDSCSTSMLKMSQMLAVAPVYDKEGNLIGSRRHRPYIVETVKKSGNSIIIKTGQGKTLPGVAKLPQVHLRLPVPQSVEQNQNAEAVPNEDCVSQEPSVAQERAIPSDSGARTEQSVPSEGRVPQQQAGCEEHSRSDAGSSHKVDATSLVSCSQSAVVSCHDVGKKSVSSPSGTRSVSTSETDKDSMCRREQSGAVSSVDFVSSRTSTGAVSSSETGKNSVSSLEDSTEVTTFDGVTSVSLQEASTAKESATDTAQDDSAVRGDSNISKGETGTCSTDKVCGSGQESTVCVTDRRETTEKSLCGTDDEVSRCQDGGVSNRSTTEGVIRHPDNTKSLAETLSGCHGDDPSNASVSDCAVERPKNIHSCPEAASGNRGDDLADVSIIDVGIKLPENIDTQTLKCSVSVHKLCLRDPSATVSIQDISEDPGVKTCSTSPCCKKGLRRPSLVLSPSATDTEKDLAVDSNPDPAGEGDGPIASTQDCTEGLEGKLALPKKNSKSTVMLDDLKKNLLQASASSKLCGKLGLGESMTADSDCLKSFISGQGKGRCNGVDKCDSPLNNTLCKKDPLVDLALHPPPSVDKVIAESLRTVECRVSLERLSSSGKKEEISGENTSQSSNDSSDIRGRYAISCQPSSTQPTEKLTSEEVTPAQAPALPFPPENGACQVSPSTSAKVSQLGRSFLDFLKTPSTPGNDSEKENSSVVGDTSLGESQGNQPQSEEVHSEQVGVSEGESCSAAAADTSKDGSESLPLHAEIALRIKAESLARSSPGESGPFKCPRCKRLYRTADSFQAHTQSCDFDLSTSDEDDDGEEDGRDGGGGGGGGGGGEAEEGKQGLRTSLRQSTLTQRRAMESSQQQLAQQAAEKVVSLNWVKATKSPHRGRSRRVSGADGQGIAAAGESVRRGRGRPRKSSASAHAPDMDSWAGIKTEQLSPKESMLGAVGLVSKDCLESQAARSKSPPPHVERRSRQPTPQSSVVRRCRSRKSSQSSENPEKSAWEGVAFWEGDSGAATTHSSSSGAPQGSGLQQGRSGQPHSVCSASKRQDGVSPGKEITDTTSHRGEETLVPASGGVKRTGAGNKEGSTEPPTVTRGDRNDAEGNSSRDSVVASGGRGVNSDVTGDSLQGDKGPSDSASHSNTGLHDPAASCNKGPQDSLLSDKGPSDPMTLSSRGSDGLSHSKVSDDPSHSGSGPSDPSSHSARGSDGPSHSNSETDDPSRRNKGTSDPSHSRETGDLPHDNPIDPSNSSRDPSDLAHIKGPDDPSHSNRGPDDPSLSNNRGSSDPPSHSNRNVNASSLPLVNCDSGKSSVLEDSDHDSDVIIVGETPPVSELKSVSGTVGSITSTSTAAAGSSLADKTLGHPFLMKALSDAEGKMMEENGVGAEKHRSRSPILSRLSSSLTSTTPLKPLHVSVANHLDTPGDAPTSSVSVFTPVSLSAGSGPSGQERFQSPPSGGILSSGGSGPSHLQRFQSPSSLLLSSSNVQADIDSDDLSFTDSEDDMDCTPAPPSSTQTGGSQTGVVQAGATPAGVTQAGVTQAGVTWAGLAQTGVTQAHTGVALPGLTQAGTAQVSLSVKTLMQGEKPVEMKSPQQAQATQLLSMLDKLSPDQKVIITQQLLKKGALSIEEPAGPPSQPLTLSQGAIFHSPKPVVVEGGGVGYVSQLPPTQQVMGGASTLRIVTAGSGVGGGHLTLVQGQDNIIMRQSALTPTLVPQQPAAASVQFLQPRSSLVVRQPVLPVSSLQPQVPFAPSPTPLTPAISVSVASSLQGGLLSVPTPLCPSTPVIAPLPTQPLPPPSQPPQQRVSYMGSFLVDPAKTSTGSDTKARLQLLSLIQGAMAGAGTGGAAVPGMMTTVTGSDVGSWIPQSAASQPPGVHASQTPGVQAASQLPRVQSLSQPPRVIRVVVDKSKSDLPLPTSTGQSVLRIVQRSPVSPVLPPAPLASPSVPLPVPAASPHPLHPQLSLSASQGAVGVAGSHSSMMTGSSGQDSGKTQVLMGKRPAMFTVPPAKRVMVERNGYVQPDAVCLADRLLPAAVSGAAPVAPSVPDASFAKPAVSQARYRMARQVGASKTHTTVKANIKNLLKQRLPSATNKQKDAAPSARKPGPRPGKVKVKSKSGHAVLKNKSMAAMKEGPLSHPIVHLSHQAGAILPQAEVEEEIHDTPLRQSQSLAPSLQPNMGRGAWPKDMPRLAFEITSEDGFSCRADSMEEAWRQVTDKVQDARAAARMKQLSYGGVNGVQMFGVGHDAVVYLVEQLAGAAHCRQYKFRYQKHELPEDEELSINPSGAARCSPFTTRKPYDVFSFLMSRHRHRPSEVTDRNKEEEMEHKSARRATSMELPMAMRFRKLQEHAKEAVGVYRSRIHGRGLFCKRNIDNGEMVIEYSGEIIRSSLTDKREKYYESKGIGCYMFRIDDCEVVDATMHGSAARFINHSCEPNCYSKVINVDGRKHIVIFASRAIKKGEELTYDYKFPIEDVKIPCTCGSRRCRKYLN